MARGRRAMSTLPSRSAELLAGKTITETECRRCAPRCGSWSKAAASASAIITHAAGGTGKDVLVYLHNDVVSTNGRGEAKAHDYYAKSTPASLHTGSASWSRSLQMPYIHLARPGTYGSSGAHAQRRTQREIDVVSARTRRDQGRARLSSPAYLRICRGWTHCGGAVGAAHRCRMRGACLGARLGTQQACRIRAQGGRHRQQGIRSIRSRSPARSSNVPTCAFSS